MLGEVISTAGPNHMNFCDSYNFMAKFNLSSPLSNVFKISSLISSQTDIFMVKNINPDPCFKLLPETHNFVRPYEGATGIKL